MLRLSGNDVELIAQRILDLLPARIEPSGPEPWLTTKQAAQHLAYAPKTFSDNHIQWRVPSEQDAAGGNYFFKASELDRWIHEGGQRFHSASK